MSRSLAGRRVLYVAPRFFGYERDIAAELERRGAEVDWLKDRPFDTPFMTAVTRFRRPWMIRAADRLYRSELQRFGRSHYDAVFVVNGQTLSGEILSELRRSFPQATFILYMWDSAENRRSVLGNLRFFDACFTFDPRSAKSHGLHFRPLFFSNGFESAREVDFDYDISFIGTAHTDRYSVVSTLDTALAGNVRRFWYLYLQARWVFHAYRLVNPCFRSARVGEFRFVPLARAEVQRVFRRSKAILDIEHPQQCGLTIRTFEALGAEKKLVTTNGEIATYDFFDPDNVCILNRDQITIHAEFLEKPYRPIPAHLYRKYSLSGWMDEILSACSLS